MSAQKSPRKMVMHASRKVVRGNTTRYTTLCGRMNAASRDGMNIAETTRDVTCKFCLRAIAAATGETK